MATTDAFAQGVQGGFGGRQLDYLLALVMIGAASFGILAVIVKRIGLQVSLGLLGSSLLILALSWSELVRLGLQTDTLDAMSSSNDGMRLS